MTPPAPYYFGSMILSDMATAYDYENWLVAMLQYRYDKYQSNWPFFVGMETLMQGRKYIATDFHPIPEDPLVYIPEDLIYWKCLRLLRRRLTILEFEVKKYYRRKKVYPML